MKRIFSSFDVFRRLWMLFWILYQLMVIRCQSFSQWPLLFPSPSATSTLVLHPVKPNLFFPQQSVLQDSGNLYHAQGALNRFHCFTPSSHPPWSERECDPSLILIDSNPLFFLSLAVMDTNGRWTSWMETPSISLNSTQARLDTSQIQFRMGQPTSLQPATFEFFVELFVPNNPIQVTVSVGNEQRVLTLMYDNREPKIQKLQQNVTATSRGYFMAEMKFEEAVYQSVGTGCDPVLGRFFPFDIDAYGNGFDQNGASIGIQTISNAIDASRVCERAISEDVVFRLEHFVLVDSNVNPSSLSGELSSNRKILKIYGMLNKAKKQLEPSITAFPGYDPGEPVHIEVLGSSLMDAAGNQLMDNVTYSGTVFRTKDKTTDAEKVGDISSKTLLAASAFVAASNLAPPSSYGLGFGITPDALSSVEMLLMGQKLYFIGLISDEIPENFRRVAHAFSWCALNVKLLWESNGSEETEPEDALALLSEAANTDIFSSENQIDPYVGLLRVVFITGLLHMALLTLRMLTIILSKRFNFEYPEFIIFPRLELLLTLWTVPAFAAACSRLFTFSTIGCVLGISLFILVPLVYLIGLWHFLHIHFFKMDPREWRVKLIIPEKEQASSDPTPLHQERSLPLYFLEPFSPEKYGINAEPSEFQKQVSVEDAKIANEMVGVPHKIAIEASPVHLSQTEPKVQKKESWFIRAFVGPHFERVKWMPQNENDKFLQRYGPIFEDFRAPLSSQRTGQKASGTDALKWKGITLATAVLDCIKRIILAMICVTDTGVTPLPLLFGTVVISFAFLLFLRRFRPYRSRWRLGLIMLVELADAATFLLGAISVAVGKENKQLQYRCGWMMIGIQGLSYGFVLMEKLIFITGKTLRGIFKYLDTIVGELRSSVTNQTYPVTNKS